LGVFLAGAGKAAAVGVIVGIAAAAGAVVAGIGAGLETRTSAGFGDCFKHALIASNSPRIAKPAIIVSFCWRDHDESVVSEIGLLVALSAKFWLVDFLSPDFQVVVILSPPLRLAQSEVIGQPSAQHRDC